MPCGGRCPCDLEVRSTRGVCNFFAGIGGSAESGTLSGAIDEAAIDGEILTAEVATDETGPDEVGAGEAAVAAAVLAATTAAMGFKRAEISGIFERPSGSQT